MFVGKARSLPLSRAREKCLTEVGYSFITLAPDLFKNMKDTLAILKNTTYNDFRYNINKCDIT